MKPVFLHYMWFLIELVYLNGSLQCGNVGFSRLSSFSPCSTPVIRCSPVFSFLFLYRRPGLIYNSRCLVGLSSYLFKKGLNHHFRAALWMRQMSTRGGRYFVPQRADRLPKMKLFTNARMFFIATLFAVVHLAGVSSEELIGNLNFLPVATHEPDEALQKIQDVSQSSNPALWDFFFFFFEASFPFAAWCLWEKVCSDSSVELLTLL